MRQTNSQTAFCTGSRQKNRIDCNVDKWECMLLNEMFDSSQVLYSEADARKWKRVLEAAKDDATSGPARSSLDDLPKMGRSIAE